MARIKNLSLVLNMQDQKIISDEMYSEVLLWTIHTLIDSTHCCRVFQINFFNTLSTISEISIAESSDTDMSKHYHRKNLHGYVPPGLSRKISLNMNLLQLQLVTYTEMPQMFKISHVNALNSLLSPKDTWGRIPSYL